MYHYTSTITRTIMDLSSHIHLYMDHNGYIIIHPPLQGPQWMDHYTSTITRTIMDGSLHILHYKDHNELIITHPPLPLLVTYLVMCGRKGVRGCVESAPSSTEGRSRPSTRRLGKRLGCRLSLPATLGTQRHNDTDRWWHVTDLLRQLSSTIQLQQYSCHTLH